MMVTFSFIGIFLKLRFKVIKYTVLLLSLSLSFSLLVIIYCNIQFQKGDTKHIKLITYNYQLVDSHDTIINRFKHHFIYFIQNLILIAPNKNHQTYAPPSVSYTSSTTASHLQNQRKVASTPPLLLLKSKGLPYTN